MNGLLFTYALTYGGAIVSLFNPYYGLLIYICFAIIKPPALWPWCVPVGNYSRVIGIALLVGWAMNSFGDAKLGRAKPIVFCFFGYFLWVTLSTMLSDNPSLGTPFIEYLLKIFLPFVAGVTLIHTSRQVWQLTWVILFSCAFLAYEANLTYIQGYDFEHNRFFALDNNSFSILMVSAMGLPLVLGLEEVSLLKRGFFLGIAAAMAHVPMFSMSRGGMVGVVVAVGTAVLIVPKNPRTWTMICAGAILGAMLAGPSVVADFQTIFRGEGERDGSAQSRVDLWRDCITATMMHPVFGVGTEHWGIVVHEEFGWPKGKEAHSPWFQTAAELGIPGVTFLALFYLLTVLGMYRAARDSGQPDIAKLSRMLTVSIAGFAASGSFVTVEGFELPYYIVLIGACSMKIAYRDLAIPSQYPWIASQSLMSHHYPSGRCT